MAGGGRVNDGATLSRGGAGAGGGDGHQESEEPALHGHHHKERALRYRFRPQPHFSLRRPFAAPPFAVAIIRRRRIARFERLKKRVQSFGGGARAASAAGGARGSGRRRRASGREGGEGWRGWEASRSYSFSSFGLLIAVRPREVATRMCTAPRLKWEIKLHSLSLSRAIDRSEVVLGLLTSFHGVCMLSLHLRARRPAAKAPQARSSFNL